jgi:hypothetical protein
MPNLLDYLAAPNCPRLGSTWDQCGRALRRADRARLGCRQNTFDVSMPSPQHCAGALSLAGDSRPRPNAVTTSTADLRNPEGGVPCR